MEGGTQIDARSSLPDPGARIPLYGRPAARSPLTAPGLPGPRASRGGRRTAAGLLPPGLRAVRLDLRGGGKGLPLARRSYHAGRSEDIRAALEEVHRWSPASPVTLI